jgi:hypothetical protein
MKSIKWISILVICLLTDVTGYGQISASSPNSNLGQSSEIQHLPGLLPADSGYVIYTYDDGIAENYFAWQMSGNMNAVKFLLQSEAATIVGARVFVGDGSYPAGGNILNQPFLVSVYASDGENGLPGTLIDSVSASVTNYGWVMVKGLNAFVTADFFIAITQLTNAPDCIPIGVDETAPKVSQSYARNMISGNSWVLSPYQDLMINALISTNVGLEEVPAAAVKIYPNPASNYITIDLDFPFDLLEVYSGTGNKLKEIKVERKSALTIDISLWESGLYSLRLISGNRQSEKIKFIKL